MASAVSESKIIIKAQDDASATVDRLHSKLLGMQNPMGGLSRKLSEIANHVTFANLGESATRFNAKLQSIGLGLGVAGVGFAAGVGAAFSSVVDVAAKAERINDLGGRLRLDPTEFQVLEKISKEAGASIEEVGGAITKFKYNLQSAQTAGGAKLQALTNDLAAFGITAKDMQSMKPIELLQRMGTVSSASNTEADEALKIEKYRNLMGRQGASIIPVVEAMKSYNEIRSKMQESGTLMSAQDVAMADAASKRYEKAKAGLSGLATVFGMGMMEPFSKFSESLYARVTSQRSTLMPAVQELAQSLTESIDPMLDALEKFAKGSGKAFKEFVKLVDQIGIGNIAMGAGVLAAAPFVLALVDLGKAAWGATVQLWKLVLVPMGSWLASTQLGLWAVNAAAGMTWATVLGPLALIGAGLALITYNWKDMGEYLQGVSKRVTEATDKLGVFHGIWVMIKEIALGAINAIIGSLNSVSDLLHAMGLKNTGGELHLVGSAMGQGDKADQKRLADSALASGPSYSIPATAPAISRQEVNGTVRVQLDKGLIPSEVKSENRSFNIDAISGSMYATGA